MIASFFAREMVKLRMAQIVLPTAHTGNAVTAVVAIGGMLLSRQQRHRGEGPVGSRRLGLWHDGAKLRKLILFQLWNEASKISAYRIAGDAIIFGSSTHTGELP